MSLTTLADRRAEQFLSTPIAVTTGIADSKAATTSNRYNFIDTVAILGNTAAQIIGATKGAPVAPIGNQTNVADYVATTNSGANPWAGTGTQVEEPKSKTGLYIGIAAAILVLILVLVFMFKK